MSKLREWFHKVCGFGLHASKAGSATEAADKEWSERVQADRAAWNKMMQQQDRRLEAGVEIEPPWIVTPEYDPTTYKWGDYNDFAREIWRPYITAMTIQQRAAYFEKWPVPPGVWYMYIHTYLCRIDDPAWRMTW